MNRKEISSELMTVASKLMRIKLNPFIKDKNERVLNILDNVSDYNFDGIAGRVLPDLKLGGDKQFDNCPAEVNAIISKHPKLESHKSIIKQSVINVRLKSKLNI